MSMKDFTTNRINADKKHFANEYGKNTLEKLQSETLNSFSVRQYYNSLQNKFFPSANDIMKAVYQIDYINLNTILIRRTPDEYEKKLDYANIAAIIILENWLVNILPTQEKNPISTYNFLNDNVEAGWVHGQGTMGHLSNIYDELEKTFKN